MQAILAWAYFASGINKLRFGGLEYFSPENLPLTGIQHSLHNMHDTQFKFAFVVARYAHFTVFSSILAVAWEVAFPVVLFVRRLRLPFLLLGFVFHIGTVLIMNIAFWNQVAMYTVFVNWPVLIDRLGHRRGEADQSLIDKTQ